VFVDGISMGTYADSGSAETWNTTDFNVSGWTGSKTVKIVPTAAAWGSCSQWGQVALNWAELKE